HDAYQSASSEASPQQVNVNAPVTVDSPWSNNGDVNQYNKAENNSSSTKNNWTDQQNEQNQGAAAIGVTNGGGDSCGCSYGGKKDGGSGQEVEQSQSASNESQTSQSAESEASSEQANVNAPVTVDSPWSSNGDVNQGNWAENDAYSKNNNDTEQENEQDQAGSAVGRVS